MRFLGTKIIEIGLLFFGGIFLICALLSVGGLFSGDWGQMFRGLVAASIFGAITIFIYNQHWQAKRDSFIAGLPEFSSTYSVETENDHKLFIDNCSKKLVLCHQDNCEIFSADQIIDVEIQNDESSISITRKDGSIIGGVLGGILGGGFGAVAGALLAGSSQSENYQKISKLMLKIIIARQENPQIKLAFLWQSKKLPTDHAKVQKAISRAEECVAHFKLLMKR